MTANKKALSIKFPKFDMTADTAAYQEEMDKLIDISFSQASSTRTIKNINESVAKSLKSKYGIKDKDELKDKTNKMLALHGLSQTNFDPMSITSKMLFEDLETINDISVDDNANKTSTNMEGLLYETFLGYKKLIGYDYLYQTIKELYGKEEAKRCMASMLDYSLALNDSTKILIPYSYYAHTPVMIRINGADIKYVTLKKLYQMFEEFAVNNSEFELDVINTENMSNTVYIQADTAGDEQSPESRMLKLPAIDTTVEVWDGIRGWQNVSKIIRHKNEAEKDFCVYQTEGGQFAFVTCDHPVILADGSEIQAAELTVGQEVLLENNTLPSVAKNITVPTELTCQTGSAVEHLPEDILSWENEAKETLLASLVDSDGTLFNGNGCSICLKTMATINQLSEALKDMPGIHGVETKLNQDDTTSLAFEVYFKITKESKLVEFSSKVKAAFENDSVPFEHYVEEIRENAIAANRISKVLHFNVNDIAEASPLKNELEYVYDITTDSGTFYANGMTQHNCYCIDASKLVVDGRNFGQVHSSPPKRVSTYISMLGDTIREISFNIAGACAVGTLFLDVTRLAMFSERIALQELRTNKKIRKYIINCFQQFIHTVNHYSRNAIESPFTNVSVFDRVKLESLIDEDNYGWYLAKSAAVADDNGIANTKEAFKELVLDYIEELQEIYIDIFNEGDPLRNGLQFPFPVTTCMPGSEALVLNSGITTYGQAFGEYADGWTDVSDKEMYTQHAGKALRINRVFKGTSDQLVTLNSSNVSSLTVTPSHKLILTSGMEILAGDVKEGDTLKMYTDIIKDDTLTTNKSYGYGVYGYLLTKTFGKILGLAYSKGAIVDGKLVFSDIVDQDAFAETEAAYVKELKRLNKQNSRMPIAIEDLAEVVSRLICEFDGDRYFSDTVLFNTPVAFRRGVLAGLVAQDASSNDTMVSLHTTSNMGCKTIEYLATSLGIRAKTRSLSKGSPKWGIRFNRHDMLTNGQDIRGVNAFLARDDSPFRLSEFGVISTETVNCTGAVYNIEVDSEDHLYTLPSGIVTSNCNFAVTEDEGSEPELTLKNNRLMNYIAKKDISRFNIYCSEGTKVASCCLASTTKVLGKIGDSVKYCMVWQLYEAWRNSKLTGKKAYVMGKDGFVEITHGFKKANTDNELYKITLKSGICISTTGDHPSVKFDGDKLVECRSDSLQVGDLLPVSKNISYEATRGNRELGRFIGLFGAEGMYDPRRDSHVAFCFHTEEKDLQNFVKDFAENVLGCSVAIRADVNFANCTTVFVKGKSVEGLMKDFFNKTLCTDKTVRPRLFNMDAEFRMGFLEGFIEGDGYTANSDRSDFGEIHIANKELAADIVAIANSVNIRASFNKGSAGNDYKVNILHNDKLKLDPLKNWHDGKGSTQKSTILKDMGDVYGLEIASIEKIKVKSGTSVYDFEVAEEDHLFQVANGIITHNCRLISDSEMLELGEGVNSFGGSQVSLGSHRVVTINFARAAYEAESYDDFKEIVKERVAEMSKILKSHRVLIHKLEKLGTQPWITNGWIDMSHMFSTFGCVGYLEAAEILQLKFNHSDFDYMKDFLVFFNNECKECAKTEGIIFNIEAIPAESGAVKFAKADELLFADEDGYFHYD